MSMAEGKTLEQRHRLYDGAEFAPAALTTTENALAVGLRGALGGFEQF
jgi:hypothetical protein